MLHELSITAIAMPLVRHRKKIRLCDKRHQIGFLMQYLEPPITKNEKSMPQKNPYRLRWVPRLGEIAQLIDGPYNKPAFTEARSKEMFREEYERADGLLRSKLRALGEIDSIGETEFSMGNPWNSSRKIGITVNANWLFTERLIELLKNAVDEIPEDYLIVLSGEYGPGAGMFYICIIRDADVFGHAPDKWMLESFGFG